MGALSSSSIGGGGGRRLLWGCLVLFTAGVDPDPCQNGPFGDFHRELLVHYGECRKMDPHANCLPTRVSDPLVGQASNIVDSEVEEAQTAERPLSESACLSGVIAALAVYAQPLTHTSRGQWAANMAFTLTSSGCWPITGFLAGGWPVTYREVIEVALYAEAWEEHGDKAEHDRPPRHSMPLPFLHELTPVSPNMQQKPIGRGWPPEELSSYAELAALPRHVHVLSTGHHASYPAAIFTMWRALLHEYEFELEDHSFDNRYCDLAGSCSIDDRFAWLGDHLRSTLVETCGGHFLKGFEDIGSMAEELFGLLTRGPDAPASRADVLLCTHPPYSCRLFWPLVLRRDKPLLGYFGGTLEAHVPAAGMDTWLKDFREMAQHPRVQFAAISPFLAEKMRYQSSVDVPAARGFGFHVLARGATYFPKRMGEVLMWKNSNECTENQESFDDLLNRLAADAATGLGEVPLSFRHLRDLRASGESSYAELASFRAVVFIPYEILLMTFYELYHVAIPMFIPDIELGTFFAYRGPVTYPHCDRVWKEQASTGAAGDPEFGRPRAPYSPFNRNRVTDRISWLEAYSDWWRFPHLQRWSSLSELVHILHTMDAQAISSAMRQETEAALAGASAFWRRAFAKVLTAA